MSKNNHKGKAKPAQRKAHERDEQTAFMAKEEVSKHATKSTYPQEPDTPQKAEHWVGRFIGWVLTSSSFTDWCITAFTLVLAVVGIYQYCVMSGQLKSMQCQQAIMGQQLTQAENQFAMSQRPWVDIAGDVKTETPLTFYEKGAKIKLSYFLKNAGNSPALGTMIFTGLHVEPIPSTVDGVRDKGGCVNPAFVSPSQPATKTGGSGEGILILPGDSKESRGIEINTANQAISTSNPYPVWASFCIRYWDARGGFHETGFIEQFATDTGVSQFTAQSPVKGSFRVLGWGTVSF